MTPFTLKNYWEKQAFVYLKYLPELYLLTFAIIKLKIREQTIMHSISLKGDIENKTPKQNQFTPVRKSKSKRQNLF